MIPALIIFNLIIATDAFIGYDCGGQHLNITSISLLDTGECDLNYKNATSQYTYIQLLQLSDYNHAEVIQCKIEIARTVYYCGMHSHTSIVHNGQANYVLETGYERCNRLHKDGTFYLEPNTYIHGIRPNSTTYHAVNLAGKTTDGGTCNGVQYSDPYGTWDNVAVQGTITISLRSSFAPVQLSTGKIFLRSGITCPLAEGHCTDPDYGDTYWKAMPLSSCDFHQYDVLYEGQANKTETNDKYYPTVYTLVTQDITFGLTTTTEQPLCGYKLLKTEHPKLFILETAKENMPKKQGSIAVDNLDIFAYVNSKFVYVEKHIRGQMISLYHNIIQQKCEMEKEVIRNTLSIAKLLPDEFAYRLMKSPGYMSVVAGEAVHIVKCIPVEVTMRKTTECYVELPITIRNSSLFLTPRSRIISRYGTQRDCSHELPTLYNIEGTWIQLTPEIQIRQLPPQQLQPLTKMTWNYHTPGPLAVSGIYSKHDIDKLRDHIMFPAEQPAMLNSIARGLPGNTVGKGTISMYDMLNEETLDKIAQNTAQKLWSGFVSFGSATAGVLGIFIMIRVIKIIIDTAIHGYALHTVYGCSLHLIGAIWSSLTHLLLHLAHGPTKLTKDKDQLDKPEDPAEKPSAPQLIDSPSSVVIDYSTSRNDNFKMHPYHELLKSLQEDNEQNPPNTSDVCSQRKREM